MKDLRGVSVLITGAASGIGRGAALAFAAEGSSLFLWDIDTSGLESLERELQQKGAPCRCFQVDVADAVEVERSASEVTGKYGDVDVLVNAAGVCVVADVADTPLEDWHWVMGVNLWGPIHTIHAFLPGMIERGSGHIVNIASAGGLVGLGIITSYCTTKFALVGLAEGLAQEVLERGVRITTVCPGLTATPIIRSMRFHGYNRDRLTRVFEHMMALPGAMSAEKTGELVVRAVKRNRSLVVTTPFAKALILLKRLFPGAIRLLLPKVKRLLSLIFR